MNDNIQIILIIIILLLLLTITYVHMKSYVAEYFILYIFSKFKIGNFELIDYSTENRINPTNNTKKIILQVINDNTEPVVQVYILNKQIFFDSLYHDGELGLGESYMAGNVWFSTNIQDFLLILQLNRNNPYIPKFKSYNFYNKNLLTDKKNIVHHYDVGNDFYQTFLTDSLSAYTCGFWKNSTTTLEEAQLNKVNTVIKKINPKPGSAILDIGCGWGKIANYVAKTTKCHVTGITISDEQVLFATENLNKNNVTIINKDYRNLNTTYDYIYSIGILEHVRYENYDEFFNIIKKCLKPGGRCLIHTIVSLEPATPYIVDETFISKHIFPGGQIPAIQWIVDAINRNNLTIIHTEYFGGQHYAKTLNQWNKNMYAESDYIIKTYSKNLLLKYEYYFKICEATFTSGAMGIAHFLITNDITVNVDNNFVN